MFLWTHIMPDGKKNSEKFALEKRLNATWNHKKMVFSVDAKETGVLSQARFLLTHLKDSARKGLLDMFKIKHLSLSPHSPLSQFQSLCLKLRAIGISV